MKKKITTIVIAMMLTINVTAQQMMTESGGMLYTLSDKTASLVHIRPGFEFNLPDTLVIPSQVTFNGDTFTVTTIGERAFHMTMLRNIVLPNTIDSISVSAFESCSSLKSIVIPENVRTIANSAFKSCMSLSSVVFPENITMIDGNAFYRCTALTEIFIPDKCTIIGYSAFSECRGLKKMTIGSSVKEIQYHAFYMLQGIEEITIKALTPPQMEDQPDDFLKSKKLIVPNEALPLYQQDAKWSKLAIEGR